MNTELEKFASGWVGISLALSQEEIELLIRRLNELKMDEVSHFHLRNEDWEKEEGVADIEITKIGKQEPDNMIIEPDNTIIDPDDMIIG